MQSQNEKVMAKKTEMSSLIMIGWQNPMFWFKTGAVGCLYPLNKTKFVKSPFKNLDVLFPNRTQKIAYYRGRNV
jgi:hypothetical protein